MKAPAPAAARHKIDLWRSLPFFLTHLAAIAFIFVFGWSWTGVLWAAASYALRMFFVTAGYHRYFSHRAYKLGRISQFVFAFMATTTLQKGVLWWAANHRHHHRFSDLPQDIHSPIQSGFWWSHVGWILSDAHVETDWASIQDFAKFPELVWINRHYVFPGVLYAAALLAWGGIEALGWGFFVSTTLLWHGTFTINSLSHVIGTRRYQTTDTSRNNPVLALVTLGEGWHNNHHCYQSSANQGFFWWEFDITYGVLKVLSWIGIARDLRNPPLETLEAKRIRAR